MEASIIMGRLFGTDGARGIANTELNCETSMQIGRAAALVLSEATHHRPKVLIGKDTRISCDMLEAALIAGLCSVGADVMLLGVIPTPAVAYLVKKYNADAGVMISASHNSCEYNGIKLFNSNGYKLPDKMEEQIEAIVLDNAEEIPVPTGGGVGRVSYADTAVTDYISHIRDSINNRLDGLKIAVDCANGSASVTAKRLLASLGADVIMISDNPNGININDKCGSTHIEQLQKTVVDNKCHCGVAFDGDADRCLAVDEKGNLIDGDKMIAMFSLDMKNNGSLSCDTAVVTVMSNLGFFRFAEKYNIATKATKVGDRYVLEEMIKGGYSLGGEQSGHIIFLDRATTGDGQLSAVKLLSILAKSGKNLSELASVMNTYPQVLKNIVVTSQGRSALNDDKPVWDKIHECEKVLGNDGRILVRASGTEPLIRVMVEGLDHELINKIADDIVETIKERLG